MNSEWYRDSHAEAQAELDDRDDSNDPEFRDASGYCEHGAYVGGSGIDWMCADCELGISASERRAIDAMDKLRGIRHRATDAAFAMNLLLSVKDSNLGGMAIARIVQDSSDIRHKNPKSRYGRH